MAIDPNKVLNDHIEFTIGSLTMQLMQERTQNTLLLEEIKRLTTESKENVPWMSSDNE